ncbi:hypothetical protein G3A43_08855 [Paraburkholderia aspalathi]|nr:hypothetical protein [Paraburkholderia aspalathi]MBK3780367.1 hypothetical protein [Paraburkholderia aspalathi]
MTRRSQYEIWKDAFRPTRNPRKIPSLEDSNRFDIFPDDLKRVLAAQKTCTEKVWTLIEGENGKLYISQGYHLVNRLGYFITEVPFDPTNPVHVRRHAQRDVLY